MNIMLSLLPASWLMENLNYIGTIMQPVDIRPATENDFPAILKLINEFAVFQHATDKVTTTLDQLLAEKELFKAFVAIKDDMVVGFATYFFAYYSWTGKALYLDDLYIVPQFRKQGIGKQILQTVIQHGRINHCKKIRWQVSGWNKNAIHFYKKMGAEIDDTDVICDLRLHS
jgi:GNAT superfamily N-acetyltransferase